ncbi:MAG: transporter, partial [Cytophagaceae bacterium]
MDREQLETNQIPIYFVAVIVAALGGLLAPNASEALG